MRVSSLSYINGELPIVMVTEVAPLPRVRTGNHRALGHET